MNEKLIIRGGKPLYGEIPIDGAKNAALKLLAASLLAAEPVEIGNVPHLQDVAIMLELLSSLGCKVTLRQANTVVIDSATVHDVTVSYELVRAMRASIVVLGPLVARFGEAKVALPGGCAIGTRPIDIHLQGLKAMGAEIEMKEGFLHAKTTGRLKGAHIQMHTVSVTGTENLMMAATLAEGITVLNNAAAEPEVVDLANFLISMGANIEGAGTRSITIRGVEKLHGAKHVTVSDRIEAGTYLVAAAMSGGRVTVTNVCVKDLALTLQKLTEAGASIVEHETSVTLDMTGRTLRAVDIETAPFPGFATDMQAQFMALNVIASGVGMIKETVFENRFMHVAELERLGAHIRVQGNTAISAGVPKLRGAPVTATDLRASACMVLAGLVAEGETIMDGIHHMDRGYANLEEKLVRVGADIRRVIEA
jgi:UDP-N-acetylglucosamine 1-carboxyvinyltransferase